MRSLQIPAQRQQMILDYIRKQEGANIKELGILSGGIRGNGKA